MSIPAQKSAQKVQAYLQKEGYAFSVKELAETTRSAADAAKAIGCEVAQIAKSLIFSDVKSNELILVIASGINRVSIAKIADKLGLHLSKADGDVVKKETGFAIGGIPPVAHQQPLKTILDQDLKQWPVLWAAAGTPFAVFSLTPNELGTLTQGTWLDVAE